MAGARHFAKKGAHLTEKEAKTHAADLRAQAVLHCKKHNARLGANFVPDTEESKQQRNQRPAAQTFTQWIENQADPRTWACNHSFQAIAEKTGMILVIFKQTSDVTWHRCTFASRFSGGRARGAHGEKPVVILLKNHHFTYLIPPEGAKVPKTWLNGEPNSSCSAIIDLTGDGGTKTPSVRTYSSSGMPSVHTKQSSTDANHGHTGRQAPASSSRAPSVHTCRSRKSTSTPSVHTCTHSTKQQQTSRKRAFTPGVPRAHVRVTAGDPSHPGKKQSCGRSSCSSKHSIPDSPSNHDKSSYADIEVWICPHCEQRFEAPNMYTLRYKRNNHLRLRHPHRDSNIWDKIIEEPIIPTASHHIPMEQRSWTCVQCGKGLPSIDMPFRYLKAITLHNKTEHPERTKKSAKKVWSERWKNSSKNPDSDPMLKQARQTIAAKNQKRHFLNFNKNMGGHKLVQFNVDADHLAQCLGKQFPGTLPTRRVITCVKCWKYRITRPFTQECRGKFIWEHALRKTWVLASQAPLLQAGLLKSWKVTKAEADRKFENLVREGIEPHPGPTHIDSTHLLITSINLQGVPGAWRAINTLTDRILLLQDTPFQKEELRVFMNTAKRRHWKVYHAETSKTSGRPNGGVTTLIPAHLRQQALTTSSGNLLITMIQGVAVINSYAFPAQVQEHTHTIQQTLVEHGLDNIPWLIAGDHNETPETSLLHAVTSMAQPCNIIKTGESTRWEGNSELDWFLTNRPTQFSASFLDKKDKISDHIAVNLWMSHLQAPSFTYRLRPQPKWNPPTFVNEDQWRKTLEKTWCKHLSTGEAKFLHDLPKNIDVNKEWTSFMNLLSKVYKEATRATAVHIRSQANEQELEKKLSQVGHDNGKGTKPPTPQRFNQVLKNAGHPTSSQAEKKLSRRLARLYELRTLAQKSIRQNHHTIGECATDTQTLICKLWPNSEIDSSTSLGSLLHKIKADILKAVDDRRRVEAEQKQHRLTKWKNQFQNATVHTVAQWIRKKEQEPMCANVCHNKRVAQTDQEAASFIHAFWHNLWNSQTANPSDGGEQSASELLAQHFPASSMTWTEPSYWELLAQIRKCHGSAGLDSWHSDEIRHLPEKAIENLPYISLPLGKGWSRTPSSQTRSHDQSLETRADTKRRNRRLQSSTNNSAQRLVEMLGWCVGT